MTFFTLRLTKICLQALNLLLLAHFEKRYISDVKRRYGFIVAPAAKLLLDLLTYECRVNKVWTEGEGVVDRHGKTGRKVFFVHVSWLVASLFTVHHRWPPKEYCQKRGNMKAYPWSSRAPQFAFSLPPPGCFGDLEIAILPVLDQ